MPLAAASGHSQECPGGRLCWKLLPVPAELAAQLLFSVSAPFIGNASDLVSGFF